MKKSSFSIISLLVVSGIAVCTWHVAVGEQGHRTSARGEPGLYLVNLPTNGAPIVVTNKNLEVDFTLEIANGYDRDILLLCEEPQEVLDGGWAVFACYDQAGKLLDHPARNFTTAWDLRHKQFEYVASIWDRWHVCISNRWDIARRRIVLRFTDEEDPKGAEGLPHAPMHWPNNVMKVPKGTYTVHVEFGYALDYFLLGDTDARRISEILRFEVHKGALLAPPRWVPSGGPRLPR